MALSAMEGILESSSAGLTLVGNEQKVTQWVLAHPSTTGLWVFAIRIDRFKFFV